MDIHELLDYVQSDCTITIFDIDKGKNIENNLSIDEAREWAENHSCELCSFEPTPQENKFDFGITINVEGVEEL